MTEQEDEVNGMWKNLMVTLLKNDLLQMVKVPGGRTLVNLELNSCPMWFMKEDVLEQTTAALVENLRANYSETDRNCFKKLVIQQLQYTLGHPLNDAVPSHCLDLEAIDLTMMLCRYILSKNEAVGSISSILPNLLSLGKILLLNLKEEGAASCLEQLLKILLREPAPETTSFLMSVWTCLETGELSFTPLLTAELLLVLPLCLEKELIEMVKKAVQHRSSIDQILAKDSFKMVVAACASRAEMFQAVTSIWNYLLGTCLGNVKVMELVKRFTAEVSRASEDFVALYPFGFQSLVILMQVNPSDIHCAADRKRYCDSVVEALVKKLECCETQPGAMTLMSHFPFWMPVVFITLAKIGRLDLIIGHLNILSSMEELYVLEYVQKCNV